MMSVDDRVDNISKNYMVTDYRDLDRMILYNLRKIFKNTYRC